MLYAITASVSWNEGTSDFTWTHTRQLPTFFLDSTIQGIKDETDAENVARRILGGYDEPFLSMNLTYHITACATK